MNMQPNSIGRASSPAEALNRLAGEEGWPILCDAACDFTEPKLSEVTALWRAKAQDGIPFRREMTARLLQPYIPMLAIYERSYTQDGTVRYKVRLMGTTMVQFTSEMSGHYLDEIIDPIYLPRWHAVGNHTFAHGGPLRILMRSDSFHRHFLVGEAFVAPLRKDDGEPSLLMTVIQYGGFDPWETVEARARAKLGL